MKSLRLLSFLLLAAMASTSLAAWAATPQEHAQTVEPALTPKQINDLVWTTIKTEITEDANDHSVYIYHVHYSTPGKDQYSIKIETTKFGSLARITRLNGKAIPLSEQEQKVEAYIQDPSAQARKRRSNEHDDKQSAQLLKMLPAAFIWTVKSQTPEEITLNYRPNPNFDPPTMEDRVFAAMAGEMVIDRAQHRIKVFRGELIHDVTFGWGILGRMNKGGTFAIIRQQLAPHIWEITETHIHINGHILFFKTLSQNEDEIDSDFKPAEPNQTLEEANKVLMEQPDWPNQP